MKILILSCDTGEGHNSAGKAIKEAAEHKGHSVTMIDMFLLSGKGTSHAVSGAYIGIVKHIPFFFGLLYKVGMLISSDKRKSPVYFANALLCKKLSAYIESNGFDAVVTPHLYPAETLSCMKRKICFISLPLLWEPTTPVSHSGKRQIWIIMLFHTMI